MASVERPTFTQVVPAEATIKEKGGQRFACWLDRKGQRVEALILPSGKCRRTAVGRWVGLFRDHTGVRKKTPTFGTRAAALSSAIDAEQKGRAVQEGRAIPDAPGGKLHLVRHVDDYLDHLEKTTGTGAKRRKEVKRMLNDLLARHRLTTPAAVNCDTLAKRLEDDRRAGPGEGERGHGKPYSIRTRNLWVVTLKAFGKWMRTARRLQVNPFDGLVTVNEAPHRTKSRRSITAEDFTKLVATTRQSAEVVQMLDGVDRAMLYTLGGYTGLRAGALTQLTPEAFTWKGGVPVAVYSTARMQKNKGAHGVGIHPQIASALGEWLKTRTPGRHIFPGRAFLRTAQLLRHDLTAAKLPYKDATGSEFDFHSLRIQTAYLLLSGGVSLPEVQRVLDHSTPKLTSNIYAKFGGEMSGVMAKMLVLPGLTASLGTPLGARGGDSRQPEQPKVDVRSPAGNEETPRILGNSWGLEAPPVGFEPTTSRLTVGCSTAELQGNVL